MQKLELNVHGRLCARGCNCWIPWKRCLIDLTLEFMYFFQLQLVSQIDSDLKHKSHVYNTLRQNLQAIERKATLVRYFVQYMYIRLKSASYMQLLCKYCSGNLMTRSLVDLVKKEDFVPESEYLQTLLVVVPK